MRDESEHPFCPHCTLGGSNCPSCHLPLLQDVCVPLKCGHVVHLRCAERIIRVELTDSILTLPLCPVVGCSELLSFSKLFYYEDPTECQWILNKSITITIWDRIKRCAQNRIQYENLHSHPEILSSHSPYSLVSPSQPALAWALRNIRFLYCKEHNMVFTFGQQSDPISPDLKRPCPLCSNHSAQCKECKDPSFMVFKCRLCCNVATHYFSFQKDVNQDMINGWYCDFCADMPTIVQTIHEVEKVSTSCPSSCIFQPHSNSTTELISKCMHCGHKYTAHTHFNC